MKREIIFLIVLAIAGTSVVGSIVWLVISFQSFQALLPGNNFSDAGNFGDAIGGLTTPIASLLGSILIYLTFREQARNNRIQGKIATHQERDREFDMLIRLIGDIDTFFQSKSRTYARKDKIPEAQSLSDSIVDWPWIIAKDQEVLIGYYTSLLRQIELFHYTLKSSQHLSDSDRIHIYDRFEYGISEFILLRFEQLKTAIESTNDTLTNETLTIQKVGDELLHKLEIMAKEYMDLVNEGKLFDSRRPEKLSISKRPATLVLD